MRCSVRSLNAKDFSDSGSARYWQNILGASNRPMFIEKQKYSAIDQLVGHTGAVNVVDGLYYDNRKTFIASSSTDSSVKIWLRQNDHGKPFELLQTILCKSKGFALALKSVAVVPRCE